MLGMLLRPKQKYHIPVPDDLQKALATLHNVLSTQPLSTGLEEIHQVLVLLWMRKWSPSPDNPLPCPTVRAIALLTLKRDRSFTEPKNVTGIIAKFQRLLRLTCLWEMKALSAAKFGNNDTLACDQLQPWFTEKFESPFNSLRSLQHRASAISYSTMALPRVWWTDRRGWTAMLYRGNPVTLEQIRALFAKMEDTAVDVWEQNVLRGLQLQVHYDHITEDLTNRDVGYCFLEDPRNACFTQRDHLLRSMLANPKLRDTFIRSDKTTGDIIWNKAALHAWLVDYSNFHAIQLARVEMLSGAPSRGTELTSMNLRNTTTRNRNIHVLGQHIAVMRTYHKSGALTGLDKLIPHSLDAVTSDLVIQDLAIARPFAEMAVHICYPGNASLHELYRNTLLVDHLKPFTPDKLTGVMSDLTLPILKFRVGINPWRHIFVAWQRKLCSSASELFDHGDEGDTIGALASGHTRATENRLYGLSEDGLVGGAEDILPLFLSHGGHWQVLGRIVPGKSNSFEFSYWSAKFKLSLRWSGPTLQTSKVMDVF
jgi:hypothetical protein